MPGARCPVPGARCPVPGPQPQLATLASLAAGAAPGCPGWMTFSVAPAYQLDNRALRLAPNPVFLRKELTAKR